jgi:D-apiose dehydrogenase
MTTQATSSTQAPRIAVVGAGYFSAFHLRGWQQCGAHVVALCDVDAARANAMAARFGLARTFTDVAQMIAEIEIDVMDIAAPSAQHAPLVAAAIAAGKPTICQKPFARSFHEAQGLTQLAQVAGVPLIVHENFRFMPWFRETKRLIENNHFGALHSVLFRLRPGDGQGEAAYLDRQPYFRTMPRFMVVETGIHYIDTFRYLLGDVGAVSARLRRVNPTIAGEDAGVVIFEFASGAIGILDANRSNDHEASNPRRTLGEMWLEGARGVMRLDGDARMWWKPHQQPEAQHAFDAGSADPQDFGSGACTALQASALRALLHGEAAENAATDYLENIRIQEAIYHSHETGKRVELRTFVPPIEPLIPHFSTTPL